MTTSDQTRACAACGGSGMIWQWCDKSRTRDERVVCPVCLWRNNGRISDRMPAADAMADAETLRLHGMPGDIREYGATAALLLYTTEMVDAAPHYARLEARAAFRAVPGLRGDR